MERDILKVLISEEELKGKVKELGRKISEDYKDKKLLIVSVLKGSIVFMADLMRAIDIDYEIDFLSVSSYGSFTTSSGDVKITKDLDKNLDGWDLLLVDDILDSGITLGFVKNILLKRNPSSIKICTLLDKPQRHQSKETKADYIGFVVPDNFVVGYGLDYDQKYRNLPYVGILKPEIYTK
ncbi:MAG: hypoxanthine phosphoribosyltransferase [Oscillospiraceae bacterium]